MIREAEVEEAARIAYETNAGYCRYLGDDSQPPWNLAKEWQRESVRQGVRQVFLNPTMTPEDSHVAWCQHLTSEGWKYGPVKDPVAKTHPSMVAFKDMPTEQQLKDLVFITVVKAVLKV